MIIEVVAQLLLLLVGTNGRGIGLVAMEVNVVEVSSKFGVGFEADALDENVGRADTGGIADGLLGGEHKAETAEALQLHFVTLRESLAHILSEGGDGSSNISTLDGCGVGDVSSEGIESSFARRDRNDVVARVSAMEVVAILDLEFYNPFRILNRGRFGRFYFHWFCYYLFNDVYSFLSSDASDGYDGRLR